MNSLKLLSLISILLFTLHGAKGSYEAEDWEEDFEDSEDENVGSGTRTGRFFWLFDGIKKRTDTTPCTGSAPEQRGYCESQFNCKVKNGNNIGSGNCGDKGVCCRFLAKCAKDSGSDDCVIRKTGALITRETGTGNNRVYVFPRIKGACQVRLDFDYFEIQADTAAAGDCEPEALTVRGSPTVNNLVICGNNTGQHMYLEYGSATDIRLSLRLQDGFNSNYAIRPTFIKCNSPRRVPAYCLQHFDKPEGRVLSFNNNIKQLNNQDYKVCVKPLDGTNSVTWRGCNNDANSFSITGPLVEQPADPCTCPTDWVAFPGDYCRRCGQGFPQGGVTVNGRPFFMNVHFDRAEISDPVYPFWQADNPCLWWNDAGNEFDPLRVIVRDDVLPVNDKAIECPIVADSSSPCTCRINYNELLRVLNGPTASSSLMTVRSMLLNADRLNTGFCLEYSQSQ